MPLSLPVTQRNVWQAVLTVLVLHALDDIVTRHLWHSIELSFLSHLPNGYLDDDIEQSLAHQASTNRTFYLVDLPRGLLEDLVIQFLSHHKQLLLERLLPTRSSPAPHAKRTDDAKGKEARGSDEMETEIMQKLIAEGRVKPVDISWRNVVLRWLLDDTLGTLVFAVIAFLLHCATHRYPLAQIAEELPAALLNQFLGYWLSLDPVFSLIAHAYVPCHLRTRFWAALDLGLNLVMSVFLRPIVPWVMRLGWVQEFFQKEADQARLNKWWEGEMTRLDAKREKVDQEIREMFDGWRTEREEL